MKNLNKKGFTLIELLVVVAIIAILAGIVLVSLNSARERSEKASLQSTLASVMPVASMCINDGFSIQDPDAASPVADTNGDAYICVNGGVETDITETWPTLPTNLTTKGYDYGLNATSGNIEGYDVDGSTVIVSCNVSTGSCQ